MRVMPVAGACAFALFSTVQFSSRHRSTLVIRRDATAHESLLTMQFFARIAAGGNRSLQPAPKLQNQVCCFEKTRPCSNIPQRVPRCYKIVLHGQYVCLNGSILGECQLVLIVVQSSFWGETRQLVTTHVLFVAATCSNQTSQAHTYMPDIQVRIVESDI